MLKRIAVALSLLAGAPALASEFFEKSVATTTTGGTCNAGLPLGRVLIQCSTTAFVRIRESNTGAAITPTTGVTVLPGAFYYTNITPQFLSFCATAETTAGSCSLFSVK